MTAYAVLRILHSYWRWAVLVSAAVVLVRALARRDWDAGHTRAARLWVAAVDIQVLLGVVLYFGFSPFWQAVHGSLVAAMFDKATRFFGIEHETAGLLAAVVTHIGWARAKRADVGARRRIIVITVVLFLLLVLWAIPWPWRMLGRPLFRLEA